jgi:hypothetical protein
MDIRKYGVAIAIAILTAILIYSTADAIAPQVDYNRCYDNLKPTYGPDMVKQQQTNCVNVEPDLTAQEACNAQGYSYEAVYGANGCLTEYTCNSCYKEQEDAREKRNQVFFYVALAMGLLAIVLGFLLPLGSVHEWVGLGFIIGGVIGLFIGTVAYWSDLTRWLRPIVILIELIVVLFIVYRRVSQEPRTSAARSRTKKK